MVSSGYSLKGKEVLIAGGSSGMGLALARKALDEGAFLHLVSSNKEKLERAKQDLGNVNIKIYPINLGDEMAINWLSSEIPRLDHLVTTAARLTFKPLVELSRKEIEQMLDSKFWGPVLLTQKFAPKMSKDGSIIYFSGGAADKGSIGGSIIGALNSALYGLARNLAYELSPIRVNIITPGLVASPTWDFMDESDRESLYDNAAKNLPVKRIGQPEDIADAAIFLMKNKYSTGAIVTVDGGSNA